MTIILPICLILACLLTACATSPSTPVALPVADDPRASYAWLKDNIFHRCAYCHAGVGKANLHTHAGISRLIIPGEPERSRLYRMVESRRMPVGWRLSDEEIGLIYLWIKMGAQE